MSWLSRFLQNRGEAWTLTLRTASGSRDTYGDRMDATDVTSTIYGIRSKGGTGAGAEVVTVRGRERTVDIRVLCQESDVASVSEAVEQEWRSTLTDLDGIEYEVLGVDKAPQTMGAWRLLCEQRR